MSKRPRPNRATVVPVVLAVLYAAAAVHAALSGLATLGIINAAAVAPWLMLAHIERRQHLERIRARQARPDALDEMHRAAAEQVVRIRAMSAELGSLMRALRTTQVPTDGAR